MIRSKSKILSIILASIGLCIAVWFGFQLSQPIEFKDTEYREELKTAVENYDYLSQAKKEILVDFFYDLYVIFSFKQNNTHLQEWSKVTLQTFIENGDFNAESPEELKRRLINVRDNARKIASYLDGPITEEIIATMEKRNEIYFEKTEIALIQFINSLDKVAVKKDFLEKPNYKNNLHLVGDDFIHGASNLLESVKFSWVKSTESEGEIPLF